MQPWDNWIQKSTNQLGASALQQSGPAAGTSFDASKTSTNLARDLNYRQAGMQRKRQMENNVNIGRPAYAI